MSLIKHAQIAAVLAKVLLRQTLVRRVNNVYMTAACWLKSQKRQRISLCEHRYILQRDRCTDTTLPSPGKSRKTISRISTEVIIALRLLGTEVAWN